MKLVMDIIKSLWENKEKIAMSVVINPLIFIYMHVAALMGKATVYKNLRDYKTGGKMNAGVISTLTSCGQMVLLSTNKGNLILVHGIPEGYYHDRVVFSERALAEQVPEGTWTVVSCASGFHHMELEHKGRRFVKDPNCRSKYCSTSIPFIGGGMLVTSSRLLTVLIYLGLAKFSVVKAILNGKAHGAYEALMTPEKKATLTIQVTEEDLKEKGLI